MATTTEQAFPLLHIAADFITQLDDLFLAAAARESRISLAPPQQSSPLLRLAPELRNRIYEEVFDDPTYIPDDFRGATKRSNRGILYACKQTLDEAEPLYWNRVVFQFHHEFHYSKWLAKLNQRRRGLPLLMKVFTTTQTRFKFSRWERQQDITESEYELEDKHVAELLQDAYLAQGDIDDLRRNLAASARPKQLVVGTKILTPVNYGKLGLEIAWTSTPVETMLRELKAMKLGIEAAQMARLT